jgi:lipopolysaccharide export system permease protein
MLYGTIASFPMILTIATFLTITITINRYCKDHEFAIWSASGLSPFYWLRLVAYFSFPLTLICAVSSMYVTPWATAKAENYANYLSKQEANMFLAPGLFRENSDGNQVFYIEHYTLIPSLARKIFIQYTDSDNNMYNLTAKAGKIKNTDGILSVVLENGHRYELNDNKENEMVLNFKEFRASEEEKYTAEDMKKLGINASTVAELYANNDPHAKAELSWRISFAAMMFAMSLLVLPVSIQTGRMQNNVIFILPPIFYALYENSILTFNGYLGGGAITSMFYVLFIHIVMIIIAIILTYLKIFPKGYWVSKNK